MPYYIGRCEYIPYDRPGLYFNVGCAGYDHCFHGSAAGVAWVWCFTGSSHGFDDVILAIKVFIADQLNLDLAPVVLVNGKNGYVLVFLLVDGDLQYYGVVISISIIDHFDIVDQVIAVQVEVVDFSIGGIEVTFKPFECFRLLEEVHHGVEVQVITREVQFFISVILSFQVESECE